MSSFENLAIFEHKRGLPGALSYLFHISSANPLTGFDFVKITALGVVPSAISAVCRVKLAIVAVPEAVLMFFLVVYIMGSQK